MRTAGNLSLLGLELLRNNLKTGGTILNEQKGYYKVSLLQCG